MDDDIRIAIELNLEQAIILNRAVDVVFRLYLNQFDVLKEVCRRKSQPIPDYNEFQHIEQELKHMFSPDLSSNSYWGIHSREISNDARTLFDLHQQLRHAIAWHKNILGGWTVNFDSLHQTDEINTPPKISIITDDEYYDLYILFFKRNRYSINQMLDKMGWRDDAPQTLLWINKCKEFALYEHNHIINTKTPLPDQEYLDFFNEIIDENGYIQWKE